MKNKKDMFLDLSIEHCWLPLTETLIEANNTALLLANQTKQDEDLFYAKFMALTHDLLVDFYVNEHNYMSIETYNRFFIVFVYVCECIYSKNCSNYAQKYINSRDFFGDIKKHWKDDIDKKIK